MSKAEPVTPPPLAFPLLSDWYDPNRNGMQLRDYFAAQALIALPHIGCGADLDQDQLAVAAYQIADDMMARRK